MLHVITQPQDPLMHVVRSDPVRPHIPDWCRCNHNSRVLVLMNDQNQILSVLCVAFSDHVVTEESDLFSYKGVNPSIMIMYSIWSLHKGGGTAMVPEAKSWVKSAVPSVNRIITLSPLTPMARKFHVTNGAHELQVNTHTVNFEYDLH